MMIVTGNNTENAPVVLCGKATYEIEFRVHVEFLKLQKLLSQQAVLIKTMFHLFLMIINCPCNEKKFFFC